MSWFTDRHFFLLAVIFYGISTIYSVSLWRRGFREDNRVNYLLLFAGYGLHLTAMLLRGFSLKQCPVNNLFEATMFTSWALVTAYLVIGLVARLRFLGAFVSPVVFTMGIFALMPALDPPHGPKPEFSGWQTSLHAALILQAYGAFALSAVSGLMYLTQEHNLKFNKLRAVLSLLPPIQRVDTITFRLLRNGLLLLTLGLVLGGFVMEKHKVNYFTDIKVVWSGVVWVAYLVVLIARKRSVATGRRFAWSAVGLFVFVLLTFWGSNLLSPIHQQ